MGPRIFSKDDMNISHSASAGVGASGQVFLFSGVLELGDVEIWKKHSSLGYFMELHAEQDKCAH